jgi:hypothetical protein
MRFARRAPGFNALKKRSIAELPQTSPERFVFQVMPFFEQISTAKVTTGWKLRFLAWSSSQHDVRTGPTPRQHTIRSLSISILEVLASRSLMHKWFSAREAPNKAAPR